MKAAHRFVEALGAERRNRLPMDERAFLDLYARTAGPLAGYLRRLTGNAAVAEDLLQDTYLRFLSQPRVPDDEDHRRNYLYRIATNLARDHFRRERRRAAAADRIGPPEPVRPVRAGDDVWPALARVSPRDRELLLLAYVEGLTHREIAAVTGLMRSSVKLLLFRARQRFLRRLREAGFEAGPAPDNRR